MVLMNGHKVSQVICLRCMYRWIAARPVDTWLDDLVCPECGRAGGAIETGETQMAEELLHKAREAGVDENGG